MNDNEHRTCRVCGEEKPRSEYSVSRGKDVSMICKPCFRAYAAKWRTGEGRQERQAIHRRRALLARYGLTIEHYDLMLAAQGGVCAICNETCRSGRPLAVDHDHETGRVRALLCGVCNTTVGKVEKFRDRVDSYLAEYGEGSPILPAGAGAGPLKRELKPLGPKHPSDRGNCRLTVEQVQEIRQRWAEGQSQRSLGREYGVANTTVIRIVHGDAWRCVPA